MGLSVSAGRLGAFLTFNMNDPLAERFGYQVALWFGTLLSGVALVGGIVYAIMDYAADKKNAAGARTGDDAPAESMNFFEILRFPVDFWLLTVVTVVYYSVVFPFQSLAT